MNFPMMSGSFWLSARDLRRSSGFDELFDRPDLVLDSLLLSDEIIQETRFSNKKFMNL